MNEGMPLEEVIRRLERLDIRVEKGHCGKDAARQYFSIVIGRQLKPRE